MWANFGKPKIGDKRWPKHPVKMLKKCRKNTCFTDEKRHRVYVQNFSVCTGTTRTHVETCARGAGTHGDVLNVHTGGRVEWTHGVSKRVTHQHTHTLTHINTHNTHKHNKTQHITHTTPHGDRQRQTETTEGEEGTKEKTTRQETRAERREKSEEREKIHFQYGGAWPFFVDAVIFWLIPSAPDSLAC